jgi:hypothetical protein
MGEADDDYTPEQRAIIKKMAGNHTPEQRAALRKRPADETPEQQARLDKARKALDRRMDIRDGLIRPPWWEKPKPASTKKKKAGKVSTPPFRPQANLILGIAREVLKWPDGKPPPELSKPEIVKLIGDAYQVRHGSEVPRNTILRAFGLVER